MMWLFISLGLIGIGLCFGIFAYVAEQNRKFRAILIANIDSMAGIDFERYLQKLLSNQGYSVSTTPASGDLGVLTSLHQETATKSPFR